MVALLAGVVSRFGTLNAIVFLAFVVVYTTKCFISGVCREQHCFHNAFQSMYREKKWTARKGAYGATEDVCSFEKYLATPEGAAELLDFQLRVAAFVDHDLQRLRQRDAHGALARSRSFRV